MKSKVCQFVFLALAAILASQGSVVAQSGPDRSLMGERWVLRSLEGRSFPVEFGVPSVEFLENGRIHGGGFCNSLGGVVRFDGAGDVYAVSRRGCPPPYGPYETALHSALRNAVGHSIENEALLLTGPDGRELATFARDTLN